LIAEQHEVSLLPFRSEILGIYPSDIPTERALRNAIERLREKLANQKPIDASYGVL